MNNIFYEITVNSLSVNRERAFDNRGIKTIKKNNPETSKLKNKIFKTKNFTEWDQ